VVLFISEMVVLFISEIDGTDHFRNTLVQIISEIGGTHPSRNQWSVIPEIGGPTIPKYSYNSILYVYEDRKGNIWISSLSGNGPNNSALYRYNEKSLPNKYALPDIIKSKEGAIFGILEARDGSIWFGTLNAVNRYDGTNITDFKYHSYK